jgi:iron uptake system component EfeO
MRQARTVVAIGVAAVLAACTTGGDGDGEGTTIDVTLQEWAVVVSASSAPAGEVTFAITNEGPEDIHEFVIFKTDLDVADLPTDQDGVVDETAEGIEVIDEVEDVEVGASAELTVTLEAGSYALVCNIYDEDEGEAHYQMGMRTAFTATD